MSLTVASCVITSAICYGILKIIMWHWGRRRLYEMASKFEGPPTLPVIGNAHLFFGSTEYIMNKIEVVSKGYPSLSRAWIGPFLIFYVTDPEQIKVICLSPKTLGKGSVLRDFGRPLLGTGLVTAPVKKWKVHRKLIQPTFNTKILDNFVGIFATQSRILTELMAPNLNGEEFEIFGLLGSCTLDMICETAMGVKIGAQKNRHFAFVEAVEEAVASLSKRFFHTWLHPELIFRLSKLGRDQKKHTEFIHRFTDNVIQMRKNELNIQQSTADSKDDDCEPTPRREVFLDHLLRLSYSRDDLTDEAIRDEVNTIILAGNESTAITNAYAMLMLASHPDVQEKAYEELYEIYGDDDVDAHPVTPKDLPRMKYLERVLKETMRLFPMAPIIGRVVAEDLEIGDRTVPSGSFIAMGIMGLQRSEKYWPDPLKFDPDRFLPTEVSKRHPYTFMTFSGGPRNCIGYNYAMMAMQTLLATVLRSYVLKKNDIVPVKDIRLKMDILLKPADPIKIRIERRARNKTRGNFEG